jgi:hypothetical protein
MAVVGKVGTYAQVQPIQGPDFGGMVERQFDKIKAEKAAKEAAKAKAKKDEQDKVARLGGLGDLKTTNINGFNKGLFDVYSQMKNEYAEAESRGDYYAARKLKDSLSTLNNATDMAVNKMKFNEGEADKLDPDFYQRNNNLLRSINDGNTDIKYLGNGEMRLTVYEDPEKTKVLFENMSPNEIVSKLDAPYRFSLDGSVGEFTKNYKPSSIESKMKDGISTIKVSDVMNDPNVLSGIDKKASEMANDSTSLAWYGKQKLSKYETDVNKFSEEEKKEAKDYFKQRILESYEKEIDLTIQQRGGRGGSGGKDGFKTGTPSTYESPSITPEGMATIPLSGAKTVTISNSTGKTLTVGGMPLDRVLYDPKSGKLYFGLLYSGSGKEGLSGNGSSAGVAESNKFTKWFAQGSDQFDKFKATYNAAFGKNLQTAEDLKNELFL